MRCKHGFAAGQQYCPETGCQTVTTKTIDNGAIIGPEHKHQGPYSQSITTESKGKARTPKLRERLKCKLSFKDLSDWLINNNGVIIIME